MRSRVTFARILAAPIDKLFASPLIIERCGISPKGIASLNVKSGSNDSTIRFIPVREAS